MRWQRLLRLLLVLLCGVIAGRTISFLVLTSSAPPSQPRLLPQPFEEPSSPVHAANSTARSPSTRVDPSVDDVVAADDVVVAPVEPNAFLPFADLATVEDVVRHQLQHGTSFRCVSRGMQPKCLFSNLVVHRNVLSVYEESRLIARRNATRLFSHLKGVGTTTIGEGHHQHHAGEGFPNPIYPADGQVAPLAQYHKYRGHQIHALHPDVSDWWPPSSLLPRTAPNAAKGRALGHVGERQWPCSRVVTRPTIFLYRMSGHSTYHMWENNLGPFFSTLQDTFDLDRDIIVGGDGPSASSYLKALVNDPAQLVVAFVDPKPRAGPKAPHLLDQMLRSFSTLPLVNASMITEPTCFTTAIVGLSSSSFPHKALIGRMLRNFIGLKEEALSRVLPAKPRCLYISRNHPKVIRGRKVMNEPEVIAALNSTILRETGQPLTVVHMEDFSYRTQVRMASETNIIFSPHGGGVANCIWMPRGSVMVEFVAPVGKTLPGMYHSMCGNSGVHHFHFLADADPADAGLKDNPRLFSNMIIPPERMVENAKKALGIYGANVARYNAKAGG